MIFHYVEFQSKQQHETQNSVTGGAGARNLYFKGTNGRQKTYEVSHVYSIIYSGFMCQTTVIFGITKDGSLY